MSKPMQETKGDEWDQLAKRYKSMTTGVANNAVASVINHADALLPFSKATAILDNGCGPGAILSKIIEQYGKDIPADTPFTAADFSQGMIDAVRNDQSARKGDVHWDKVETRILDATNMQGVADDTYSHITAGWVYFMTTNPLKCLTESRRILKNDGVLALSSWQHNEWMTVMLAGAKAKSGTAAPIAEIPKEWTTIEGVCGELKKAGFKDVGAEEVLCEMKIDNREHLIEFFMSSMPHVKKMLQDFTDEEKVKAKDLMTEEMFRKVPQEPGVLTGISIVGWGRK